MSEQTAQSLKTQNLYKLIHQVYVLLDDGDNRVFKAHGVNKTQYHVLMQLDLNEGQRLTAISQNLLLNKSTITRIIDQLELAKFVARAVDTSDRRAQQVVLTPKGEKRREIIHQAHIRSLEERMGMLTEAQRQQMIPILENLQSGLSEMLS